MAQHASAGSIQPGRQPLVRADLTRIAGRLGVPAEVVEKDYVLSYLLAGLTGVAQLSGLRFKGGTALKKVYFGAAYRSSEDLDFSAVAVPQGPAIEPLIAQAVQVAEARLTSRGRFRLEFDRPPERGPHPGGQDAFRVRIAFPWQSTPMVRVKLEITHDEPVLLSTAARPIHHDFEALGETLADVVVDTYALEEIIAEKLRALRQTHQRLEARGWNRPRSPRDYYDLWRVLTDRAGELDAAAVREIVPRKMAHRGVSYQSLNDFFTPELLAETRRHWQSSLGTFVSPLPNVEGVLTEVRPLMKDVLALP
ncbi:MAG: nucleotidyl transferase AbiEii/AbiGii toxin family protein [Chloroflexi bacterium]|nr:nucleotidyl transferase AbiEii/AbiGii toxin family protein [Chloroflexota bacterium]